MLGLYRYTDKEIKELLSALTVIVDTRENEISHITSYFDAKKIPYTTKKLDVGDYSCLLPANPGMGIVRDIFFPVAIERKSSLDELSGNISGERARFESELLRGREIVLTLLVEGGRYEDIIEHKYKTQFGEKAFMATLFSFKHRYGVDIQFIGSKYSGLFIYQHLYYYVRNLLK